MKVCFISASWIREREILNELNRRVDLLFICPYRSNGNYTKEEVVSFCKENNIDLIINDFSSNRARSLKKLRSDFTLTKKIKKVNPDIIYIESFGSPYFAVFCRILLGSKKTIVAIMDYKLHQRSKGSFKFSEKFFRSFQLKYYRYFQFFSYSQEKLFRIDYPHKRSFAIRLFLVGTNLMKSESAKVVGKVNFLYFGRIFYYKGVDVLIEAANLLSKKRTDFVVTIAGDCNNWQEDYYPLIKNPGVFDLRVRFIPIEELPELFQKATFLVTPYREVTQSGPLLRGYYYNLIPIASNEEGFVEYINDEKTGFLFENESAIDLSTAMNKALSLSELEKNAILDNIESFKNTEFDVPVVVDKYISMFNNILNI